MNDHEHPGVEVVRQAILPRVGPEQSRAVGPYHLARYAIMALAEAGMLTTPPVPAGTDEVERLAAVLWESWGTPYGYDLAEESERESARMCVRTVLAALSVQHEIDLAQRLVLTLGAKRYPITSLEKVGDRITLTAELETP